MKKTILVTDVDNTLFDWQEIWFQCFSAMANEAIALSGVEPELFYSQASAIHQKYGTSEYAFLLEEIPALKAKFGGQLLAHMAPAIDSFRAKRREVLRLYDGVQQTLVELRRRGVLIVAYTESQAYYTNYRFRKLGLDKLIDRLYSPPDHDLPATTSTIRAYAPETYELAATQHCHTPANELKPNPDILLSIISEVGASPERAVYVGDSKMKDVYMAQQAQVMDVWAEYGAWRDPVQYGLLKKVTHWTQEMVEREEHLEKPGAIIPTLTCKKSFAEILRAFE